jgi:DNA-binding FrmR family transcriptional regulator
MEESGEVCKDIIAVLAEARGALLKYDSRVLSEASNHTIHCIGVYQSQRALYAAIIIYALSKIVEKETVKEQHPEEFEDFVRGMAENLEAAAEFVEKKDFKKFDSAVKGMLEQISEFDKSFSSYVQKVIEFAKLKKGASIYEHGISLSSVAKMLGVSKWDLMEKVSETKVYEKKETKAIAPRQRIIKAKKILGAD